jgi:predicted transcriptional regulator
VCYYVSCCPNHLLLEEITADRNHDYITSQGGGKIKHKSKKASSKKHTPESNIEFELELLQRHMTMLKAIIENEPVGIIRLSEMLNCPQHKVRYSMRILEQEGLIKPSLEGAITTDKINNFLNRLSKTLDGLSKSAKETEKTLK